MLAIIGRIIVLVTTIGVEATGRVIIITYSTGKAREEEIV